MIKSTYSILLFFIFIGVLFACSDNQEEYNPSTTEKAKNMLIHQFKHTTQSWDQIYYDNLYCINLYNMETVWEIENYSAKYNHVPYIVWDNYLIKCDYEIKGISLETGEVAWKFTPEGGIDAMRIVPIIEADILYIHDRNNGIMAINLKDKEVLWRSNYGNTFLHIFHIVNGPYLYVINADESPEIVALNKDSGDLKWSSNYGSPLSRIYGRPIIDGDNLYFGDSEYFVSVNAITGIENWRIPLMTELQASPVVYNDNLIFSTKRNVYSLDKTTGVINWSKPILKDEIYGSPYIEDGLVVINSYNQFIVLNADNGSQLYQSPYISDVFAGSPIIYDEKIFLGGINYYCYNLYTGKEEWFYSYEDKYGQKGKYPTVGSEQPIIVIGHGEKVIYTNDRK